MKEKSVRFGFKVFNKETSMFLANGYVVIVTANRKTGRATQIPSSIMSELKSFLK